MTFWMTFDDALDDVAWMTVCIGWHWMAVCMAGEVLDDVG